MMWKNDVIYKMLVKEVWKERADEMLKMMEDEMDEYGIPNDMPDSVMKDMQKGMKMMMGRYKWPNKKWK